MNKMFIKVSIIILIILNIIFIINLIFYSVVFIIKKQKDFEEKYKEYISNDFKNKEE